MQLAYNNTSQVLLTKRVQRTLIIYLGKWDMNEGEICNSQMLGLKGLTFFCFNGELQLISYMIRKII